MSETFCRECRITLGDVGDDSPLCRSCFLEAEYKLLRARVRDLEGKLEIAVGALEHYSGVTPVGDVTDHTGQKICPVIHRNERYGRGEKARDALARIRGDADAA